MKKYTKIILAISGAVFFVATVAYAAVQLSVSQQRVKTLKATLTYQDVVAAPQMNNDPSTRLVQITNILPNTEILSAYMKTIAPFTLPGTGASPEAVLGAYDGSSVALDGLSQGSLGGPHIINQHAWSPADIVPVFTNQRQLKLRVQDGSGNSFDLGTLTSGTLEIYVNYLEH